MSAADAGIVCQMCNSVNPAQARYCLNCGTRLPVGGTSREADADAFEDALEAVVIDAPAQPIAAPPAWTPAAPRTPPPTTPATPLTPTPDASPGAWMNVSSLGNEPTGTWGSGATGASDGAPQATWSQPRTETTGALGTWGASTSGDGAAGSWGTAGPGTAQEWPTVNDTAKPRRWPWIILSVVGALLFCCCGLAGIGVMTG